MRSNSKSDTSSSANGEKARSNSQTSGSNKDKSASGRGAANKAKSAATKKSTNNASNSGMGDRDQPHANGSDLKENGVNGSEDIEMGEDSAGAPTSSFNVSKDRQGDEKMTVVVPPSKGSRLPGSQGKDGDVAMHGAEDEDSHKSEAEVDPRAKAVQGSSRSAPFSRPAKEIGLEIANDTQIRACRYQNQLLPPRASC